MITPGQVGPPQMFMMPPIALPQVQPPSLPPTKLRTPKEPPPTVPSQTLYIRNLHEKRNPKAITKQLTDLFSEHGKVLQVVASRKIKGQAFVVMSSCKQAKQAMLALQGKPLYDRPVDIQYSRRKSFVVAETDGTIKQVKKDRDARMAQRKKELEGNQAQQQKPAKTTVSNAAKVVEEFILPNAILFVQNLTSAYTKELLEQLFGAYPGFKEVRVVPGRSDIAFVEYVNEQFSTVAKHALHGHRVDDTHNMQVTFAKR